MTAQDRKRIKDNIVRQLASMPTQTVAAGVEGVLDVAYRPEKAGLLVVVKSHQSMTEAFYIHVSEVR